MFKKRQTWFNMQEANGTTEAEDGFPLQSEGHLYNNNISLHKLIRTNYTVLPVRWPLD
jgi:hypothetical protein